MIPDGRFKGISTSLLLTVNCISVKRGERGKDKLPYFPLTPCFQLAPPPNLFEDKCSGKEIAALYGVAGVCREGLGKVGGGPAVQVQFVPGLTGRPVLPGVQEGRAVWKMVVPPFVSGSARLSQVTV